MKKLNKREYLGKREYTYHIKYGYTNLDVTVLWNGQEYTPLMVVECGETTYEGCDRGEFPYKHTPNTIDAIEEIREFVRGMKKWSIS